MGNLNGQNWRRYKENQQPIELSQRRCADCSSCQTKAWTFPSDCYSSHFSSYLDQDVGWAESQLKFCTSWITVTDRQLTTSCLFVWTVAEQPIAQVQRHLKTHSIWLNHSSVLELYQRLSIPSQSRQNYRDAFWKKSPTCLHSDSAVYSSWGKAPQRTFLWIPSMAFSPIVSRRTYFKSKSAK